MEKLVVLHCSDSSYGNAELLGSWHRAKGWNELGYHFVVLNGKIDTNPYDSFYDGLIETGRHILEDGAHVKGFNEGSIGVCLIGNSGKFTDVQLNKVKQLLLILYTKFGVLDVKQHSDLDPVNKSFCAGLSQSFIDGLNYEFGKNKE